MTLEEVREAAKLRVRKKSTDKLDDDVYMLVDFVLCDLKRIGVDENFLIAPDPLITEAILTYVKANYGMNDNHDRLMNNYNMILTKIKGGGYKSKQ